MKNKIYHIFILAGIVVLAGCNKDLDTKPTTSIDVAAALNTGADVQVALVGSYAALGGEKFYGGYAFVTSELLANSGELNWTGTYLPLTQINNKAIPVDNVYVADMWLRAYAAINDVNNVLNVLAVVATNQKARVEGEAKCIRACALFDLVRLYGRSFNDGDPTKNDGVPIVLTPTTGVTPTNYVKRSPVAEVYAQVITDLMDAEAKLPATNGFFATKYTAAAMLARVYLQKGDFANAVQAANRALGSAFALTGTYAAAFPYSGTPVAVGNTSEDVFAMQVTASSGTNSFNTFFSANGRGDIQIDPTHTALYETGDTRLNLFYNSGGSIYTGKFDNAYGNVHIVRLAEMYLIRAEANFRLSTAVGAAPLDDINTIRGRVVLPALTLAQLTLAKILNERKLELAFEGFAIHDLKRLKASVGTLPYSSPRLVLPVPDRERIVNPNLTQNSGY